jgi:hypothetical protein
VFFQLKIGKESGLGQTINAFLEFDDNKPVVDEWLKLVFAHDAGWNCAGWYSHVFVVLHWSVKVKIGDVHRHEFCSLFIHNTVQQTLHSCQIDRWCSDITVIVD